MKIALVHDALITFGGAERVFQYLCEEFKEADVFTLSYNPQNTLLFFKSRKINVTWINKFVQSPTSFKFSFPIATCLFKNLDLSAYDVAISSSASIAKYINVPNGKHFYYCYYPTRALWEPDKYFGDSKIKLFLNPLLPYLRKRDKIAAHKVDHIIAISNDTKNHIMKYYNKDSIVINSPIDSSKFYSSNEREDYYLIVSRLEKWKKVDYAIRAFNALNLPLKIIGSGKEEKYLKSIANSNITFMGSIGDESLAREYSRAKAVIFTPHLEYGLIPLEANASGTPIIAFGEGGITETMVNYNKEDPVSEQNATAVFFYEQTEKSLIEAILDFNNYKFDSDKLISHAKKWDVTTFKRNIRKYVINNL